MAILSLTFSNDLIELIFKGQDIANLGDATGLQGANTTGDCFEIALYKNDGNEADYPGYDRYRLGFSDWNTSTDKFVKNANQILFPENTGTSNVIASFKVFYGVSGSVTDFINVVYESAFDSTRTISSGESPKINALDIDLTIY